MVTRVGTRASVKHSALNSISDQFDFQQLPPASTIVVTERQRVRLILGTFGRVKASSLESDAIKSAVIDGVFLDYDATGGELVETRTHEVLTQVLDDLASLAGSDIELWDERIVTGLSSSGPHRVSVFDLMLAFSFAAHAENLFNQMRRACWLLSRSAYGDLPIQRLPTTPLGPDEDLKSYLSSKSMIRKTPTLGPNSALDSSDGRFAALGSRFNRAETPSRSKVNMTTHSRFTGPPVERLFIGSRRAPRRLHQVGTDLQATPEWRSLAEHHRLLSRKNEWSPM